VSALYCPAVAWALMEDLLERGALKQSMLPVCNTVLEVGWGGWALWLEVARPCACCLSQRPVEDVVYCTMCCKSSPPETSSEMLVWPTVARRCAEGNQPILL